MEEVTRWFIEITFDGFKLSQSAAIGFIIYNWKGKFIQAIAFNLGASSFLVVKAIPMLIGA